MAVNRRRMSGALAPKGEPGSETRRCEDGTLFYTGSDKDNKLRELAEQANQHHREVKMAWRGALEHAKQAGDALLEARRITGRRGKWGRWVRSNFEASMETARIYQRIARNWNHPLVKKAKAAGITVDSIATFLKIIRGKKLPVVRVKQDELGPYLEYSEKDKADMARRIIREQFAQRLRELQPDELFLLETEFEREWESLYGHLRDTMCLLYETEYYREHDRQWFEEQEQEKREVRQKIAQALNQAKRKREEKRLQSL